MQTRQRRRYRDHWQFPFDSSPFPFPKFK